MNVSGKYVGYQAAVNAHPGPLSYEECCQLLGEQISMDAFSILLANRASGELLDLGIKQRTLEISKSAWDALNNDERFRAASRTDVQLKIIDDTPAPAPGPEPEGTVIGFDGKEVSAAEFAKLSLEDRVAHFMPADFTQA